VEIAGVCGGSLKNGNVFFNGCRLFAHERR
jgi:hypothetical protein